MTALEALRSLSAALGGRGNRDPHKEAEIILTRGVGMERVPFYRDDPVLSPRQIGDMERILERRQKGEPLQYIIGSVDFFGLDLRVGPGVLVPRPETELLVEEAIRTIGRKPPGVTGEAHGAESTENTLRLPPRSLRILDLCTGSGCIGLALAKAFPEARVVGTDISEQALAYAGVNARINGIGNATFLKGDLFEPVKGRTFDLIVANPPYIRSGEIDALQPEIKGWEPLEALDGGRDGLRFYREILSCASEYLVRGGSLIMELGQGEAGDVLKVAERSCMPGASVLRDYSGIERVLRLTFR